MICSDQFGEEQRSVVKGNRIIRGRERSSERRTTSDHQTEQSKTKIKCNYLILWACRREETILKEMSLRKRYGEGFDITKAEKGERER